MVLCCAQIFRFIFCNGFPRNSGNWNVLCWNIRGLNATDKWDAVRNKIEESSCSIFCLQETKKERIDMHFIRNFAPRRFDRFDYIPSNGASEGLLVCWNSSIFSGVVTTKTSFAMTLQFTSVHNLEVWKLTTVYGPCSEPARTNFVNWMKNIIISPEDDWLFLGDFNFYRSLEDRNKPGGNVNDTLLFNDIIGHLGLVELPLKGRAFTWSNMQQDPLLEQLDWFFTSVNWTTSYPNTMVLPLAKITSHHIPCKVLIDTNIPRSNLFRLENFWPQHPGFYEAGQFRRDKYVRNQRDSASLIAGRLKNVRYSLKQWSKKLSNLNILINNCNKVIFYLDCIEEVRNLWVYEWNFRNLIKAQIAQLLRYKNMYWKKRYIVNRIKFGDECTKFFHAMATIPYRKDTISQLQNDSGQMIMDHEGNAALLWTAYKNRMAVTNYPQMLFDLQDLIQMDIDLSDLVVPFTKEEIDRIVKITPPDKAPGPDGFNGMFFKKCWPLIKGDFYKLCEDFYNGTVSLESINNSYITLVPKVNNPETLNDFRAISLLNSSLKLLTKILAERLQKIILKLIHANQYGFIRSWTIQDCLAWSFEYIHQCHQSKREIIIVNLDFAKAFDTIEHSAILDMMKHLGFPDRWLQ